MARIELLTPVKSEGSEITFLEFREPITQDVVVCGYPYRVYANSGVDVDKTETEIKLDSVVVASLAARLASVPKSTIKNLSLKDFNEVSELVFSFFQ